MSWQKYTYPIKIKIDHLSERERLICLAAAMMLLLGLWYMLFFNHQMLSVHASKQRIDALKLDVAALTQKNYVIESLANSDSTEKLMAHYQVLKAEKDEIEAQFSRYQQRFISERELSILLHDMLRQTDGVIIDDFNTRPQTETPALTTSANTPLTPPVLDEKKPVSEPMIMNHYELVLHGKYFAIMDYLKRLEGLSWQLYWDNFSYEVKEYPEGSARVMFYTLKPERDDMALSGGVQ